MGGKAFPARKIQTMTKQVQTIIKKYKLSLKNTNYLPKIQIGEELGGKWAGKHFPPDKYKL